MIITGACDRFQDEKDIYEYGGIALMFMKALRLDTDLTEKH